MNTPTHNTLCLSKKYIWSILVLFLDHMIDLVVSLLSQIDNPKSDTQQQHLVQSTDNLVYYTDHCHILYPILEYNIHNNSYTGNNWYKSLLFHCIHLVHQPVELLFRNITYLYTLQQFHGYIQPKSI